MAVLYRKYRPQTFGEVLNQKPIITTLKNQVKSGGIAHAYLFTGSRGVGKTSVARILAKAVNCISDNRKSEGGSRDDGEACGICEVCKAIEQGAFLDLVEIDAASNTGVDNIRELIEHVKFSPSLGKYKVFIIDEVHMLSKGAFNALLKTLEEPPKHAIFILATTEINKVPATIISRTQRFDFKALSAADILEHLQKVSGEEKVNLNAEVLELVAQNAEGSVRDALSLLDKVMTLGEGASLKDAQQLLGITDIGLCENLLELMALGKASEVPDFFANITEQGLDYSIFNRDFLEFLRKVMVYKITDGKINFGLPQQHLEKFTGFAAQLSAQDLIFITRLFLKSFKDLSGSPNPQVPLLIAGIEAAYRKIGKSEKPESRKPENEKLNLKEAPSTQPRALKPEPPILASQIIEQEPQAQAEVLVTEDVQMSLDEAGGVWPKVIAKVKAINGPLASMLKNCELLGVENSRIVLGVKFAFDKQSLESAKNTALITTFIHEVSGKRLGITGRVIKKEEVDSLTPSAVLSEALKVFGGELIE